MLKFEDLTVLDLDLIKSGAIYSITRTPVNDRVTALVNSTFDLIHSKGFYVMGELSVKSLVILSLQSHVQKGATSDDVIDLIFKAISIEKDHSGRVATCSTLGPKCYLPYEGYKKPWMF